MRTCRLFGTEASLIYYYFSLKDDETTVKEFASIDKNVPTSKDISKCRPFCSGLNMLILWTLEWRHNGCDGVWNDQPYECLLNRLFRPRSKKTSNLRVTGLCEGNSLVTGEFPAQRASNAENVSIWWRHHVRPQYVNSLEIRTTTCVISRRY